MELMSILLVVICQGFPNQKLNRYIWLKEIPKDVLDEAGYRANEGGPSYLP